MKPYYILVGWLRFIQDPKGWTYFRGRGRTLCEFGKRHRRPRAVAHKPSKAS